MLAAVPAGTPAWFVGRFEAATVAEAQVIVEAVNVFAQETRVAEIRMTAGSGGWRSIKPGGVALLVTCPLCGVPSLVPRAAIAAMVTKPLTIEPHGGPLSHSNGRGGRCVYRISRGSRIAG